ncbi:ABC transporter permease subunit [Candidatus Mycoplasma pogonae]
MRINFLPKKKEWSSNFDHYRNLQLNFYDQNHELNKIDKYYQNRIHAAREKMDKEIENWQDDFFNLAIAINEKKQNIENFFAKQIEKEYQKLKLLEKQHLNLIIDQISYQRQQQNLQQEIANNVEKINAAKVAKLAEVDAWFAKKEQAAKKHVKKVEQTYQDFYQAIVKDSEKRYKEIKAKYQEIAKNNQDFFKSRQITLQKQLDDLNNQTTTSIQKLETDFANGKLGVDNLETSKINLMKEYSQKLKSLQKEAAKTLPEIKKQRWINKLWGFREEDRLINYADRVKAAINNSKLLVIFIFIAIITGALNTNFFDSRNWLSAIIQQNLFIAYIAIGETFVILTGGIDLSVGSLAGFGGVVYLSLTMTAGWNFVPALIVTILVLILIGLMNGFFVAKLKIPPFIITLAGLLTLSGVIKLVLNGVPISNYNDPVFTWLNAGVSEGSAFTNAILLFIIIVALLLLFMKFSRFSRYVYATGDNKNAAKFSGIKVDKILISVYTLSGFFAALGAITLASKTASVDPNSGTGFELDAITAVALGGTSLAGGRGGIGKTIIGWFAISMLINSFSFLNLDANVQLVAKGIIIVLAIIFDGKYNFYSKAQKLYYKTIAKKI